MVLYYAADLLWGTRIRACGEDVGVPMRPVRSIDMLEARLADSDVKGLVADLEGPEIALALLARLRGEKATQRERAVKVVAWGPHMEVDLLRQAKAGGADAVMTRGAFSSRLAEILVALEKGAEGSGRGPRSGSGGAGGSPLADQLED